MTRYNLLGVASSLPSLRAEIIGSAAGVLETPLDLSLVL